VGLFRGQAQQALDDARRHEGLVYAQVGRQAHSDGSEEIAFVSVWRGLEDLYRWVGGTDLLDTPVLNSGNPEVFESFEVQHYETCDATECDTGEADAEASAAVGMNSGG
jgi:heme-degrading monooxygenase HmoA